MEEVVIVSAVRTAVGRLGGGLKDVEPEDLGKIVIKEAITRAGIEPGEVDEVILGQTKQSADAANLARVAALKAGLPIEVPAYTVMRQCGSGLQAIHNAAASIMIGEADIVVAGGVENMSKAPYYLRGARYGYGAGNAVLVDSNTESQPRSQPYRGLRQPDHGTHRREPGRQVRHQPGGAGRVLPPEPEPGLRRHRVGPVQGRDRAGGDQAEEGHRASSTPTSTRARARSKAWPRCRPSSRRAAR